MALRRYDSYGKKIPELVCDDLDVANRIIQKVHIVKGLGVLPIKVISQRHRDRHISEVGVPEGDEIGEL